MPFAGRIRANGFAVSNGRAVNTKNSQAAPVFLLAAALAAAVLCVWPVLSAYAMEVFTLTLKDHRFVPTELHVPANERFRIEVENHDPTPAEFESTDLRVEKIIVGGGKITVFAGPLKPGTYKFFDDYHPDAAKGTITVSEHAAH